MKNQILKAATVLSLVVALNITLAVAPAAADSFGSIKVDVPFDFTADQTILPAGKYTIQSAGVNGNGLIRITNEEGETSGLLLTNSTESVQSKTESVVIFHRYGDQYFLFQVWAIGDTIGVEIPKSSIERQAARSIEANKGQSATVGEIATVIIAASKPPRSK